MKSIFSPLLILCGILLLVACNGSDSDSSDSRGILQLQAEIEQPHTAQSTATHSLAAIFGQQDGISTHTTINEDTDPHTISWSQYDLICVHFDTDPEGVMRLYELSGTGNTSTGNFTYSGSMSVNPDIPYDQIPALPSSYNSLLAGYSGMYTQITPYDQDVILQTPLEIFMGMESIKDFPMIGSAQAGQPISFNCPFGLIQIPVTGNIAIERIYFDTTDQQQEIAGYFVIDQTTYQPTFQGQAGSQNQFSTTWASSGANGTQLTDTPLSFYVVLPPGTYEAGTLLQFQTPDGTTIDKRTQMPFTVNRAQILNLPTVYVGQ
ncbi:hypothetical protein [uncultured Alistipes sp.]|uniref:hypothetical protein n=1 Tax=uncultured Alistipes sp. TaxID=538949 RepID=UPI002631B758|nr:hypothetical protein [uncultured Alistipes sp.]